MSVSGQINHFRKSIYFETGKHDLNEESQFIIRSIMDSVASYKSYRIMLKGNTDDVGDSLVNKELSENRVQTTKQYFITNGVPESAFKWAAYGEEKPIANNETDEGKQRNRRVDIQVSYMLQEVIDSNALLPSIWELYKQTERVPQQFCINNERDTFIRCEQGTIIKIKANTFKTSRRCRDDCITFSVKEDFLQSDMILDNLSTTSNGRIIETQGMVYLGAVDCRGKALIVNRGSELLVFQPTDTIREDAQLFTGSRAGHDSDMNWTVNNTSVLSGFTMKTVETCGLWICGGVRRPGDCDCPFFKCRLKRRKAFIAGLKDDCNKYDNKLFRIDLRICRINKKYDVNDTLDKPRKFNRVVNRLNRKEIKRDSLISRYAEKCDILPSGFALRDIPDPCQRLYDLFKQYGVDNYQDLFYELNKEMMDSFGVRSMGQLRDSFNAVTRRGIELNYDNKNIAFEDLKYYVYGTSRLGYSNIDIFANVEPEDIVTMTVNVNAYKNTDCKLVFRDRSFVIPAEVEAGIFQFPNMPKGERVWIVTLLYRNGKPYLSMEETVIDDGIHGVNYESLTLDQLKERLQLLNSP